MFQAHLLSMQSKLSCGHPLTTTLCSSDSSPGGRVGRAHAEAEQVEHGRGEHAGGDARRDEVIHRVAAEHAQAVRLLADRHRAQLGRKGAADAACTRGARWLSRGCRHESRGSLAWAQRRMRVLECPGGFLSDAMPAKTRGSQEWRDPQGQAPRRVSGRKGVGSAPARMMEVMTGVSSRVSARPSTPPTDRVKPSLANSRTNCGSRYS